MQGSDQARSLKYERRLCNTSNTLQRQVGEHPPALCNTPATDLRVVMSVLTSASLYMSVVSRCSCKASAKCCLSGDGAGAKQRNRCGGKVTCLLPPVVSRSSQPRGALGPSQAPFAPRHDPQHPSRRQTIATNDTGRSRLAGLDRSTSGRACDRPAISAQSQIRQDFR